MAERLWGVWFAEERYSPRSCKGAGALWATLEVDKVDEAVLSWTLVSLVVCGDRFACVSKEQSHTYTTSRVVMVLFNAGLEQSRLFNNMQGCTIDNEHGLPLFRDGD